MTKRRPCPTPKLLQLIGDPTRTRTWDPMVKSHLLYRLSYRTVVSVSNYVSKASRYELEILPIHSINRKFHANICPDEL